MKNLDPNPHNPRHVVLALDQIYQSSPELWNQTQTILLESAVGRTLAQDIFSDREAPPFHRSAMDGIAIAHQDWNAGHRQFTSLGILAAGLDGKEFTQKKAVAPSPSCIEIMTGAAVPPGFDTVVRYEDLTKTTDGFQVLSNLTQLEVGKNIHPQGLDYSSGQKLLSKGTVLLATTVAVLATCGYSTIQVYKKPRVLILSTGSELVPIDSKPLPYQIRNSNIYALQYECEAWKIGEVETLHVKDDQKSIKNILQRALDTKEVIILSGGVSMGLFDYVPTILKELGVIIRIHGVNQKPGKPLLVGTQKGQIILGLPGNPVSCLVNLRRYLIPLLNPAGQPLSVTPPNPITPLKFMTNFPAVKFLRREHQFSTISGNGSGDFYHLVGSDGFVEVPPLSDPDHDNKTYNFYPWGGIL